MSIINTGVNKPSTSVLIPVIRNIMPTLVAQQITSVQPMTNAVSSAYAALFETKYYAKFNGHNKKYWPNQVELKDFSSLGPAEQWCYQNFKSRNWRNYGKYFAFKREEDYMAFLLKWS